MRKIKPRFDIPAPTVFPPVQVGVRARIGLDATTPRKLFDTSGTVDKHSQSRPPRAYDEGFSEVRRVTSAPLTRSSRAIRLWSKDEF